MAPRKQTNRPKNTKKVEVEQTGPTEPPLAHYLRHIKPRLVPLRLSPFKQQYKNVRSSLGFFAALKEGIEASKHPCPLCGSLMQFVPAQERDDNRSVLLCPNEECGHYDELSMEPDEALRKSEAAANTAHKMLIIGMCFAIGASIWALVTRNTLTIIGGVMIALILWLQAAGYRYRQWQYENMRVYEARPPVLDWLKSEYDGLFGKEKKTDITPL